MADNQQTRYPLNGLTSEQFFVLLIQAAQSLKWKMTNKENKYSLRVPLSPESDSEELLVGMEAGAAVIEQNNKGFRFGGTKNSNGNVMLLIAKLNEMRTAHSPDRLTEQFSELMAQQQAYDKDLEERRKADKLTPLEKIWLAKGTHYVTYSIIGINLLVYILMVVKSGAFLQFTTDLLIQWGGDVRNLSISGQWYRLFTSTFLHGGLLHIAFNMYALFSIGTYLEPLLGRWRYLTVYIACGILASLASTWWDVGVPVSIGASGAIFGMFGVFLALLTTNFVEKQVRGPMLTNMAFVVVINLVLGSSFAGIDNAAHIGGLISGILFGYLYYYGFISRKDNIIVSTAITIAVTFAAVFLLLPGIKKDDTQNFAATVQRVLALDEKASKPIEENTVRFSPIIEGQLKNISLPAWQQCKTMLDSTEGYLIPGSYKKYRNTLVRYVALQTLHTQLLIKRDSLATNQFDDSIKLVREKVAAIVDSLNKQ